jgi:hypothetical protein
VSPLSLGTVIVKCMEIRAFAVQSTSPSPFLLWGRLSSLPADWKVRPTGERISKPSPLAGEGRVGGCRCDAKVLMPTQCTISYPPICPMS